MDTPKKSLGQHWLRDKSALQAVVDAAGIGPADVVLEIGPGMGTLTELLVGQADQVIAIELDHQLAVKLAKNAPPNLEVVEGDILKFDLNELPSDYKVVANIPYYLTSNLLRVLAESTNPPAVMSLLVQKEVAERIAAEPGQMSLLSVSVQVYYRPNLQRLVAAELFTPPPKVDSQVISLERLDDCPIDGLNDKAFFQVVKAGFSGRRKKLRSSLSAGLRISKGQADQLLEKAGIDGNLRAQALSIDDWVRLTKSHTSLL